MRIGLITTLDTNIGDDFIREGLCGVLREILSDRPLEFVPVNKHEPWTVYSPLHPVSLRNPLLKLPRGNIRLSRMVERLAAKLGNSRFDSCKLIVQCGTPVLWPRCSQCEWAKPLWRGVVGRLHQRVPAINLAAGSCYPWERQPEKMEGEDRLYAQEIFGYCRLTTTRDPLASRLFGELEGVIQPPEVIPCSASLASRAVGAPPGEGEEILINFMDGGGHFDWEQNVDSTAWRDTMKSVVDAIKPKHKVKFICHSKVELELAEKLDATIERVWPKTPKEYFAAAARGKAGICNRLHASVALGGMGIPTIAVGTDTRMLMVAEAGLPAVYVKDANAASLLNQLSQFLDTHQSEKARLLARAEATWQRYRNVITSALKDASLIQ